jgi:hypothetical protein
MSFQKAFSSLHFENVGFERGDGGSLGLGDMLRCNNKQMATNNKHAGNKATT